MRTTVYLRQVTAALSLAVLANTGCAEKTKVAAAPPSPAKGAPSVVVAAEPADAANARWSEIKDLSYDSREAFFTGLKLLQARLDEQISALVARRAAMTSTANTKDWDFAMKDLASARSYLTGTGETIRTASPESWAQDKERIGQAWLWTQTACAKVKASTTL